MMTTGYAKRATGAQRASRSQLRPTVIMSSINTEMMMSIIGTIDTAHLTPTATGALERHSLAKGGGGYYYAYIAAYEGGMPPPEQQQQQPQQPTRLQQRAQPSANIAALPRRGPASRPTLLIRVGRCSQSGASLRCDERARAIDVAASALHGDSLSRRGSPRSSDTER